MTVPLFEIKAGDTLPVFEGILSDALGVFDLTGASAVRVHVFPPGGTAIVDRAAVVVSAVAGHVRYPWTAADVLLWSVGDYRYEVEAQYASGDRITFPNRREGYPFRVVHQGG